MDTFRVIVEWHSTEVQLVDSSAHFVSGWNVGGYTKQTSNPYIHFFVLDGLTNSPTYADEFWVTLTFNCVATGEAQITLPAEATDSNFITHSREVWRDYNTANEIMYDVMVSNGVVEQREPTTPSGPSGYVGGEVFSANKLAVLSPYLALIGLVGVISTVVAVKRRRA